jgi:hypothetical protein
VNGSQSKFLEETQPISQNQIQCTSLLTRSRLPSYHKATSPQNRVRTLETTAETKQWFKHSRAKIGQIKFLTVSQVFHRTPCRRDREAPMRAQQEQEKLKPLKPMDQEQDLRPGRKPIADKKQQQLTRRLAAESRPKQKQVGAGALEVKPG